ncbi:uncharacterized protein LOC141855599 [Brevipalpus obovatus]|uniref:uncharacterized protein LOC141855599 n=1 Tax=Brevipalpus obovatus TaxID=246614 RepID=UPI003D9F6C71
MVSKFVILTSTLIVALLIPVNGDDWQIVLDGTATKMKADPFMDVESEKPIVQKAHTWLQLDKWGKAWPGFKEKSEELKKKVEAIPENSDNFYMKIVNIYDQAYDFYESLQE